MGLIGTFPFLFSDQLLAKADQPSPLAELEPPCGIFNISIQLVIPKPIMSGYVFILYRLRYCNSREGK